MMSVAGNLRIERNHFWVWVHHENKMIFDLAQFWQEGEKLSFRFAQIDGGWWRDGQMVGWLVGCWSVDIWMMDENLMKLGRYALRKERLKHLN